MKFGNSIIRIAVLFILICATAFAQSSAKEKPAEPAAKPCCELSPEQRASIESAQKDRVIWQQRLENLQLQLELVRRNQAVSDQALAAAADKVRRENGWPETVTFNYGTLTFAAPEKKEEPAAAPPATSKKPIEKKK